MNAKVKEFFEGKGFAVISTGGNCTAWARDYGDGIETLVTTGDPSAPEEMDEPAVVTRVDKDGNYGPSTEYASVSELIEKVNANHPGYIL